MERSVDEIANLSDEEYQSHSIRECVYRLTKETFARVRFPHVDGEKVMSYHTPYSLECIARLLLWDIVGRTVFTLDDIASEPSDVLVPMCRKMVSEAYAKDPRFGGTP